MLDIFLNCVLRPSALTTDEQAERARATYDTCVFSCRSEKMSADDANARAASLREAKEVTCSSPLLLELVAAMQLAFDVMGAPFSYEASSTVSDVGARAMVLSQTGAGTRSASLRQVVSACS